MTGFWTKKMLSVEHTQHVLLPIFLNILLFSVHHHNRILFQKTIPKAGLKHESVYADENTPVKRYSYNYTYLVGMFKDKRPHRTLENLDET